MTQLYEVTFWGSAAADHFPEYQKEHETLPSAKQEGWRIYHALEKTPPGPNAHPCTIYGPTLRKNGIRLW